MGQAFQNNEKTLSGMAFATWGPALAGVAFLAACQPMLGRAPGQPVAQAAYQADDTALNTMQPAAGPQPAQAVYPQVLPQAYAPMPYPGGYPGYPNNALSTLEGNQQVLQQRLERIEQALLRLDKRMQLVERNELGRMSGANPAGVPTTPALPDVVSQAPAAIPLAQTVRQAMREDWGSDILPPSLAASMAQAPETTPYASGFAPVSQVDTTIRSTLQAAPNRLPSLADQTSAAAGRMPQSAGNMAIWTVRYEPGKVWPDRSQLPTSRAVVELLRNSQTVTLVARGPNPTRPEFQERVRALSRYLAKVAALETVPISTLATPQLDTDTIEVLATP